MSQQFHPDLHKHHQAGRGPYSPEGCCHPERLPDDSIAGRLLHSIRMFHKQEWDRHMISGYTPGEVRVLMGLMHFNRLGGPGMKVSEISSMMNVTSPTITQFINGLEGKGLVERVMDEHDRRAVRVKLTAEGVQVVQQVYQDVASRFNGLVEYLGEEDSVKLADLLMKVYHYEEQQRSQET